MGTRTRISFPPSNPILISMSYVREMRQDSKLGRRTVAPFSLVLPAAGGKVIGMRRLETKES